MSSLRQASSPRGAAPLLLLVLSACGMAPLPLSHVTPVPRVAEGEGEGEGGDSGDSGDVQGVQRSEFRITCKYEMGNCERRARKVCSGSYDVVNRGNSTCADCGLSPSDLTDSNDDTGTPVYQGTLHVRCR